MRLGDLTQLVMGGLAMGCVYSLVALQFVIIWQTVGVLNYCTGDIVMLGAYLLVTFTQFAGVPFWLSMPLIFVVMAGFGLLFEFAIYRPIRFRPGRLDMMVATILGSMLLKNVAQNIWGPFPFRVPSPFGSTLIRLGSASVVPQYLFIMIVTAILMAILYAFQFTSAGIQMRATAQDKEAASIIGVNIDFWLKISFIVISVIGATAGVLVAPIFHATIFMAPVVVNKAFAAAIIGGFGSVPGAIIGGLLLGLIEAFAALFVSSAYRDAIAFVWLILFLTLMPTGIFKERVSEKA